MSHRSSQRPNGHNFKRHTCLLVIATVTAVGLSYRYRSFTSLSRTLKSSSRFPQPPLACSMRAKAPSIRSYLSHLDRADHWMLLKWKADGTFDEDLAQPISPHPNWVPPRDILEKTNPSPFGRVVLLLDSDQVSFVPWDVEPPVPVWVFSKPRTSVPPKLQNLTDDTPDRCDLEHITLVPTPYDTGNFNKHCVESVARKVKAYNFTDKINKVVWRGAKHWPEEAEQSRAAAIDFARNHANEPWLDVQESKPELNNSLEMHELAEYRYHLDLGGLSGTSWGGFRWKLCSGLLVFKVDSWADDWWYDTLEPWQHYIPVRADVSDLAEQYQWSQDHPEQVLRIIEAGRQKCLETLGPDKARERYRVILQQLADADEAIMQEADAILSDMVLRNTGLDGISKDTVQ